MKKKNITKKKEKTSFSFKILKNSTSSLKGRAVVLLTLAIFFLNLAAALMPIPAWADLISVSYANSADKLAIVSEIKLFKAFTGTKNTLPESKELEVSYTRNVLFTAYNSEVGQCDDTPCITANGFNVCQHGIEDTIAMNGIRMGTKIRIPELFGDRVFVVRDRMNSRYGSDRGDVWMLSKLEAKTFGVKLAKIEVLK